MNSFGPIAKYKKFEFHPTIFSPMKYQGQEYPGFKVYLIIKEDGTALNTEVIKKLKQSTGVKELATIEDCEKIVEEFLRTSSL